ncbi:MAG TPA: adenosylmethionine--8-amino-7-oxononanoate transaminase [Nitrosopumilaceae archaeon]|nr:adenosylmethionine--8-amino-7-oxononanoate transaminase [Nitrosopumilaceae archaeon]
MNSKKYVWHPYTQMREWKNFDVITKGEGMWLIDVKGNKLLDGVASMWCNVWGHSKKELVNAMIKQTKKLQHSSLFNLTNDQAELLSEKIVKISPGMDKVFYSDDGSTAMEIAVKMALQYWQNMGIKNKSKIVSLKNGYHGDTTGAMSLGYVPLFFSRFKKILFPVIRAPTPEKYRMPAGFTFEEYQKFCIEKIENIFSKNNDIAAFFMESGAQVAGGVVIYPTGFQSKISKLCKKYNILFVLDEIATGFGRLGSLIEYQTQNSRPDIVSYGKMLTGGYLPLAATLTSKGIYESFLGRYDEMKHFLHGHTFTGNPIACATAITNLELYEKNKLISEVQKRSKQFESRISEINELNRVGDVRHRGMLMGIELVSNKKKKISIKPEKLVYKKIFDEAKKHKIYLRTLGNIVMLVPPLAISKNELDFLLDGTIDTIKKITKAI